MAPRDGDARRPIRPQLRREHRLPGDRRGPSRPGVPCGPWPATTEMLWSHPRPAAFLERLAGFSRLIVHDRRGTGLSDPWESAPIYEQQVEDLLAVLDAAGAGQVALFGASEAGRLAAIFAATYPERVRSLTLFGVSTRGRALLQPEFIEALLEMVDRNWGSGGTLDFYSPSLAGDEDFRRWYGHYERAACSPGMARKLIDLISRTDIADVLPAIRVPTLVLRRENDPIVPRAEGEEVAASIPGARYVELPGGDHLSYGDGSEELLDEVEEFVTGERQPARVDRVLLSAVHGHRGLHRAGGGRGRRALARPARSPRRAVSPPARTLRRSRGEDHGRRLPGRLRRPCSRGFLCSGRVRGHPPARPRDPRGSAHRGVRAKGRRPRRARRAHRGARDGTGLSRRGARVEHGQGPRGGLGPGVRGPRGA